MITLFFNKLGSEIDSSTFLPVKYIQVDLRDLQQVAGFCQDLKNSCAIPDILFFNGSYSRDQSQFFPSIVTIPKLMHQRQIN